MKALIPILFFKGCRLLYILLILWAFYGESSKCYLLQRLCTCSLCASWDVGWYCWYGDYKEIISSSLSELQQIIYPGLTSLFAYVPCVLWSIFPVIIMKENRYCVPISEWWVLLAGAEEAQSPSKSKGNKKEIFTVSFSFNDTVCFHNGSLEEYHWVINRV